MKRTLNVLMLLLGMSVLFSACSNEEIKSFDSIVGTWQLVSQEGWGTSEVFSEEMYLHFENDGTLIEVDIENEIADVGYGKWSIAGNSLTVLLELKDEDWDYFPMVYTILEITNNTMRLSALGVTQKLKRVSDSVIEEYL